MPVWHELTQPWREAGELVVVGIAQEQHPERCALYAQWQGLDWPILWDPFHLSGSPAVPNIIAVDEHGIVRDVRPNPRTFVEEFLEVDFTAPAVHSEQSGSASRDICGYGADCPTRAAEEAGWTPPAWSAWHREDFDVGQAIEELEQRLYAQPEDAPLAFRAGVARRMRYDSESTQPEDFQVAVDLWTRALQLDPNQYIWRRRIQQYGPRMDKPYPFYNWVQRAKAEVRARGEVPIALLAELTPAELALPGGNAGQASGAEVEPDPEGRIQRDEASMVSVESAVAFDTSVSARVASVHMIFRPSAGERVHWNREAGPPLEVWLSVPGGWQLDARSQVAEASTERVTERAESAEPTFTGSLQLNAEVTLPEGAEEGTLTGYALYYVCEDADGTCRYLRRDFSVTIARP